MIAVLRLQLLFKALFSISHECRNIKLLLADAQDSWECNFNFERHAFVLKILTVSGLLYNIDYSTEV